MTYAMIAFIIGQLLDVWTTRRAISLGKSEANPIVVWLMDRFGVFWPIPKLAVALCLGWVLFLGGHLWTLAGLAAFFWGLAGWNTYAARR